KTSSRSLAIRNGRTQPTGSSSTSGYNESGEKEGSGVGSLFGYLRPNRNRGHPVATSAFAPLAFCELTYLSQIPYIHHGHMAHRKKRPFWPSFSGAAF